MNCYTWPHPDSHLQASKKRIVRGRVEEECLGPFHGILKLCGQVVGLIKSKDFCGLVNGFGRAAKTNSK